MDLYYYLVRRPRPRPDRGTARIRTIPRLAERSGRGTARKRGRTEVYSGAVFAEYAARGPMSVPRERDALRPAA